MKKVSFFSNKAFTGFWSVALLLLFVSSSAQASPYLRVSAQGQMVDWTNGTVYNFPDNPQYASTGPITQDSGLISFADAMARSIATADYGTLRAYAYRHSNTEQTGAGASAGAVFNETLTISKDGLNGTAGRLNIWVDVDGLIGGTIGHPGVYGGSGWSVRLNDSWYSEVSSWDWQNNTGRESYHGFLGQTAMFTYGQPFDITLSLSASAGPCSSSLETNWADYLNTMKMNMGNSQVLDANQQPITGYTLSAASGHDYTTVPVPAAVWLLGSGLLGLVGMKRKIRK